MMGRSYAKEILLDLILGLVFGATQKTPYKTRSTCNMLYFGCLYVISYMLYDVCYKLYCYMLYNICYNLYVVWFLLDVVWYMLSVICYMYTV